LEVGHERLGEGTRHDDFLIVLDERERLQVGDERALQLGGVDGEGLVDK
jgi:hypothetical protein